MTSYPADLKLDFRQLDRSSIIKVLRHYGALRAEHLEAPKEELGKLAGILFQKTEINNDNILDEFVGRFCHSTADSSNPKKRIRYAREHLDTQPAKIGEQVAAKFSRYDENGSWVLGNITDFDSTNNVYHVQDEDDVTKIYQLHSIDVIRLDDNQSHLRRGDLVLAVFPETTSFYRATVSKKSTQDVIVRFEDDEDHTGRCPPKRVPNRFVLSIDEDDYV